MQSNFRWHLHIWHASAFKFGGTSAAIAVDSRRQYLEARRANNAESKSGAQTAQRTQHN
jgi:hypothetical protein